MLDILSVGRKTAVTRGRAAIALLATCLLAAAGHRALVATPEHAFDQVHIGDTYVVSLFDGQVADAVARVKKLGIVQIAYHSFAVTNSVHVESNRGEAFLMTGTGHGTTLVALRAPKLAIQCARCRTVHYFFRASP
jgi:hypothetical protein